jgi:hypothetical protein
MLSTLSNPERGCGALSPFHTQSEKQSSELNLPMVLGDGNGLASEEGRRREMRGREGWE